MKNTLVATLGVTLGAACLVLAPRAQSMDVAPGERPMVVVGVYDSRAVATAWVRSDAFGQYLRAQTRDIQSARDRARESGDLELAEELDALGPAMQRRIHEQGFGTAPVDGILARIAEDLPAVAAEAGVDVVVSRWALTYRAPDARLVDVTDLLVERFEPDEATRKVIGDLRAMEPAAPGAHFDH